MLIRKIIIFVLFFIFPHSLYSKDEKLFVVTTTSDLKALTQEIGGNYVHVEAFCKGTQDPHHLEAKPSFMLKTNKADFVIANGLGLELGWLPKVLIGGRNSKVMKGQKGYLEVGSLVSALEIPQGNITREQGDVHPEGNPHITLDPLRLGDIAIGIAKKLAELDSKHSLVFLKNAESIKQRLLLKTKKWQERINKSKHQKIISYHKTLSYFCDRFGIQIQNTLEPVPGVPATASHILEVIKNAKKSGIKLIWVENYFSDMVAKRVAQDLKDIKVISVPVSVLGLKKIKSSEDLFEYLVSSMEK